MSVSSELRPDGIRVVTMAAPPVNALTVQGWFDVAAALDEAVRRPGHEGRDPPRRGQGLQRRRRHQGDAEHRGVRRPARRQQGLLRGVQGGLRVRGAGDRRGQRLLRRRRGRPGRQLRHRGRQRRRLLRRPGGQAGRARRRHAHGPAGPPAPDAHPLLHRAHHQGDRARAARLGLRGRAARGAGRRRAAPGRGHRRQGHPGDPGRQGGAQRDRPDRRQQELPVRAGVHLRAQPDGRQRRAPRRLRWNGEGCEGGSDQGPTRQADDDRRGRRDPRGRHHPRHRRLGAAAQADGAGPRDPPLRPQGPDPGQLGRRRRRAAGPRRQGEEARLRLRLARLGPAGAQLPEGPPGRHHPRGRRARRGDVPDRAERRGPAAAVPADAGRARLRRAGQQPVDQDGHQPVRRRRRPWSPCPRSSSTSRWCT